MPLTRRRFVSIASQSVVAAAVGHFCGRPVRAQAKTADPFVALDGVAQAQAIAKGDASPSEILELAIKRIERLNPRINAVVTTDFQAARSRARKNDLQGAFAGVPFLVKDLDDFAGMRTTYGSRAMLSNIAKTTDPYVQACVETGVNVLGKSNTPEFGLTGTTESLALGPCYNPWDITRSCGGSSGGAAAAVAAGMVAIAHGNDGGGSIRIPASCCGVFGLKPSRDRLIGTSDEYGLSVQGAISRTVRDNAFLLAHTERPEPAPGLQQVGLVTEPSGRRLTIGLSLKGTNGLEPAADVRGAILSTAKLCEELGHDVRIARIEIDGRQMTEDFLVLWSSFAGQAVELFEKMTWRKATHQDLEPLTLAFAERHRKGGKQKIAEAAKRLGQLAERVKEQMQPYDVVLSPVLSTPPPIIGDHSPTIPYEMLIERLTSYAAYTPLFNVTGMPAMSVPLHWTEQGLPIGSQFAAKVGDERTLLELAYELEEARPWAGKWAPWSAAKVSA